jgi:ABC-2 type transport system ATP-binding protein
VRISVKGVSKRFGSTLALDDVTLDFAGRVNLVLGTNGSGKSTLINVLAGLTYPQNGAIVMDGQEVRSSDRRNWRKETERARRRMGFMLDRAGYPAYLEGAELLEWRSPEDGSEWVEDLVRRMEMLTFVHRNMGGYSSGMTQKLGLVSSVASVPEFVLWDEPTANLDAPSRKEVAGIIIALAKKGSSFIIASHTPADFEGVADWMCVMRLGRVVKSGMIDDLAGKGARFVVETDQPLQLASEALRSGAAAKAEVREGMVELETSRPDSKIIQDIAGKIHVRVGTISVRPKSITELYAEALEEALRP